MEEFAEFVRRKFRVCLIFLLLGLGLGLIYSLQLLGDLPTKLGLLHMASVRSAHVSLMLYGFIPLLMTLLPFSVCAHEGIVSRRGLRHLQIYFQFWYVFLLFMTASLLFGTRRLLPFYDFAYELNYFLAFGGVFYNFALYAFTKKYSRVPLWLRATQCVAACAPIALVILMSPNLGRVEATIEPSHGDNTLAMSLALIPAYYLAIKLHGRRPISHRGRLLWMLPLAAYLISLAMRNFAGPLSYTQEWIFQYFTLLYIPLLILWFREARIRYESAPFLFISAIAFLLIDIEGNLLFIPGIRALFHRNDLVIGHAHLAIGIALLFLAMSAVTPYLERLRIRSFATAWSISLGLMIIALSIAGTREAGLTDMSVPLMWSLRSVSGLVALLVALYFLLPVVDLHINFRDARQTYHLAGCLSDGLGGLVALIFGPALYQLAGIPFQGGYQYVVFSFMTGTGVLHLLGLRQRENSEAFALGTAWIRLLIAATFYALFKANVFGPEVAFVSGYDLCFAMVYFIGLRGFAERLPDPDSDEVPVNRDSFEEAQRGSRP